MGAAIDSGPIAFTYGPGIGHPVTAVASIPVCAPGKAWSGLLADQFLVGCRFLAEPVHSGSRWELRLV